MKTSSHGLKLIEQREGKVLHIYLDSRGFPTGGVGHLLLPKEKAQMPVGTKITDQQCEDWLTQDVVTSENAVNACGVTLAQHQFDALVSLTFNIGPHAFATSTIARDLKAGKVHDAGMAIMLFKRPPEIIGRRHGEYLQFITPYQNGSAADAPGNASDVIPQANSDELQPSPILPAAVPAGDNRGSLTETSVDAQSPADNAQPSAAKPPVEFPVLKSGSKGPYVVRLQNRLMALGYSLTPDGLFGAATESIVRKVQRGSRLTEDGIVGRSTWAALGF